MKSRKFRLVLAINLKCVFAAFAYFTMFVFFFLNISRVSFAQNNKCEVCEDFLNSFNNNDIKSLKKCLPFYVRPFINNQILESHFKQDGRYGKYTDYTLTEFDGLNNQYKYKIKFDKDLVKTINYSFALTKFGKIHGTFKGEDIYSFPSKRLSEIYSEKSVAEILEEDFPSGFYGSVVFIDSDNSFKSYQYKQKIQMML